MKALISSTVARLRKQSPIVLTALGIVYELALAALDFTTPEEMSFTIFYLLGVGFVGWGVGARAAVLVSAVASTGMAVHERIGLQNIWFGYGMLIWNGSTRFLLFAAAGWLTAEITRLNQQLQNLVVARTAQLAAETERHKSTSERLGEALSRLRVIIAGAPIVVFAVDHDGMITFEDGRALASLGVLPGEHIGQHVLDAYTLSPQLPQHMRRALSGEQFRALVEIGPVTLETWYTPTRLSDATVAGYTGVAVNVTDQRRLERQILEISDREQARIGQELHDGLCQQLVSLAFDANSMLCELSERDLPQARTAARMAEFLDQAITEARQLARGLFPIRLETQGLAPALQELARSARERFGVTCKFESSEAIQVGSKAVSTHLYRIAQEAVTNALKHGHAHSIEIRLLTRGPRIELTIQDDGCGLPVETLSSSSGMGLHIMDYRARSIGGNLVFGPVPSGGTLISCCVPSTIN
jgi:two-component system, LuxR family, sensor kinase FixL